MKNNHLNKCITIIVMLCIALSSYSVLDPTWNVGVIAPGQVLVRMKPVEILSDVEVLLEFTYPNGHTKQQQYVFTDEGHKYLNPGYIYDRVFKCDNTVEAAEGIEIAHMDRRGTGDRSDDVKRRIRRHSGGRFTGPRIITLGRNENVLVTRPLSFRGWQQIAGTGITDAAPTVCEANNTIYLFSKEVNSSGIYVNTSRSGEWTGRMPVPEIAANATPAAVYFAGNVFLFARTANNRCFFTYSSRPSGGNSAWQGWQEVPGNLRIGVSVSATVIGSYLYVFTKNLDNNMMVYNRYHATNGWWGWATVPANFTTNTTVISCKDPVQQNKLWIFAKDPNGSIYFNAHTANNNGTVTWTGWRLHPKEGSTKGALAATSDENRIYLFARGTSNKIYQSQFSLAANNWTEWKELSNERPTDMDIVVTGREISKLILFCTGRNDNRIYMNQSTQ